LVQAGAEHKVLWTVENQSTYRFMYIGCAHRSGCDNQSACFILATWHTLLWSATAVIGRSAAHSDRPTGVQRMLHACVLQPPL
jgi:hypothetical protein